MFCPLCKAEYRPGFDRCSDCRLLLVGTEQEAKLVSVHRIWKGDRQHKFDAVLAALSDAGIAFYPKQKVSTKPRIWIFGIPITGYQSTFQYEVWILRSDLEKANETIRALA
jgi:hypothetical protein